jgi:hypothetical protein
MGEMISTFAKEPIKFDGQLVTWIIANWDSFDHPSAYKVIDTHGYIPLAPPLTLLWVGA